MTSVKINTRTRYNIRDTQPYTVYSESQIFAVYYEARKDLLNAINRKVCSPTSRIAAAEFMRRCNRINQWFEYKYRVKCEELTVNALRQVPCNTY